MLYPQNGDRVVATDTVTSHHPICIAELVTGDRVPGVCVIQTAYTLRRGLFLSRVLQSLQIPAV